MKLIRSIETKRYLLEMLQDRAGKYHINYKEKRTKLEKTATYTDYALASFYFDRKLEQLEGH